MASRTILITGGAGYVGSALVPSLLKKGNTVKVLDLFWYGEDVFGDCNRHERLARINADIRNKKAVREALIGVDAVIHLACISNDPSFELDPGLGKSINLDAFEPLVRAAAKQGVKRFIYASSSSVYGVKSEPDVREDSPPEPLTDYSRFKLECEKILIASAQDDSMTRAIIRPATLCGYARRMRLDLTVNILTIHALVNRKIRVFGGKQLRPHLNVMDMVRVYEMFLDAPADKIHCVPFNAGFQNTSVEETAFTVMKALSDDKISLEYVPTDDMRSYHINSDKIRRVLGFTPAYSVQDAVLSIAKAYRNGLLTDPLKNPLYHNILRMKELALG